MGLRAEWSGAHPPTFDIGSRSVVDIGGGPVSLLLKCVNLGRCDVLDPGGFPAWVSDRYSAHQVTLISVPGETDVAALDGSYDEAWVYNVLQHVDDPAKVIENARRWASTIRIFEWIDVPPYPGHPHMLTRELLDEWLDGHGYVAQLDERGCVGTAYSGIFRGRS
jgi:hypothetical protein